MKYVKFGNTDLVVSKACLGCLGLSNPENGSKKWAVGYDKSKEIVTAAIDKGINFFDTAMSYQRGTSEEYLGRIFKELGKRDEVIIQTKYTPRNEKQREEYNIHQWINKCVDDSLTRLQTDYIDIYIMHMWDYHTPIEESLTALNNLIKEGKVKNIGVSNAYAYQVAEANTFAKYNGLTPFSSVQGHYSLIFREEEREMNPYCYKENIALTPYSPLAGGRLSKRPDETSVRLQLDDFSKKKYDAMHDADQPIIDRVAELADEKGVSMTAISIAWLMAKVTAPIVGVTKENQIDGMIEASEVELTEEEMAYLEEPYVPHRLVGAILERH